MIRINLLQKKDIKRKKSAIGVPGANLILAVFAIAAVLELGGLYFWYMQVAETAEKTRKASKELGQEKERLEGVIKSKGELDTLRKDVLAQRTVFTALKNSRVGPLNALLFISYTLQRLGTATPEEEYRVLTDLWTPESLKRVAGTNDAEWDPDRVWLTQVGEQANEFIIEGLAKNHEDAMTFLKRLRTGIYFDTVDFISQQRQPDSTFGVPLIQFKLKAFLNFNPAGYMPLPADKA